MGPREGEMAGGQSPHVGSGGIVGGDCHGRHGRSFFPARAGAANVVAR